MQRIKRLQELSDEQAALCRKLSCKEGGTWYKVSADGHNITWETFTNVGYVTISLPVAHCRSIALHLLGMKEVE